MPKPPATRAAVVPLEARLAAITEPKRLPSFVDPADLPPLVREGGAALDPQLVVAVIRAAASDRLGEGGLGARLRDALSRESADAFALHLLTLWGTQRHHGRSAWILAAVAALGGDRCALALEPLVVDWSRPGAGDTDRKRAIAALPALRQIGTDTALLVLMGLRQKAVLPSVLEATIETLAKAAKDRKLTVSELADRITPTLGLDARGTRALGYGPRAFTLALDAHFEPSLRDDEGAVLDALPEAAPGDDPARVAEARLGYSLLTGALREAVKVQSFRLEQDMVDGRRWDTDTWTRCLARHPLMVSFTRRLLWGVYDKEGALLAGFRTAEDETLVGLEDAALTLPRRALIGVVHPLHLAAPLRLSWSQHFADYEIIPPFPQLGRAVTVPADAERDAPAVTRFASSRFKSGVIRDTLVRRGWERDPGHFRMFYQRVFSGDRVLATAHLDPGVVAGAATYETRDQAIPRVDFRRRGEKRNGKALTLGEVPAVAFSEALLDVQEALLDPEP